MLKFAVKEMRLKKGISIPQLRERTRFSQQYLWQLENGNVKGIPLDKLELLSKALGCSHSKLIIKVK